MSELTGKRVEYDNDGPLPHAGAYWHQHARWFAMTPSGHMADLSAHDVTEHDDGTITVAPSILVSLAANDETPRRELWHGYLERGIWREC